MAESTRYEISSTQNERIKFVRRLKEKRERDESGLMIIEGVREIGCALRHGIVIEEIYACPDVIDRDEGPRLMKELTASGVAVTSVTPTVFGKIAYRETSGGFVAIARKPRAVLDNLTADERSLILVVDAVEKPGNLGALLRSADGAGVTGLIISSQKTDLYHPNVIRASLGAIFAVPTAIARTTDAIQWLKSGGIAIITATPSAEKPYTDADMRRASAIVVGSEDAGVGAPWSEAADLRVRIPMRGDADSLNVSIAAAIMLYEALRQRGHSVRGRGNRV